MKILEFSSLIRSLPVGQQSFTSKRSYSKWADLEEEYDWLRRINDKLFANQESITISRNEILGSKSDLPKFLVLALRWGYPKGMIGDENLGKIFANRDLIVKLLRALCEEKLDNVEQAFISNILYELRNLGLTGLGISTLSKLLYFLELRINMIPTIILDRRIINILQLGHFNEFRVFKKISYSNAAKNYIQYIETTHNIAEQIGVKSENIELFLFMFGGNLKERKGIITNLK